MIGDIYDYNKQRIYIMSGEKKELLFRLEMKKNIIIGQKME